MYKFLERKKDREKLTQRFPSFFKLVYCMYFVYFLLFCTTYALAITNISKEYNSKYNTKMKFPKFQKHFSFLKPFEFPLKDINKKKRNIILFIHISRSTIFPRNDYRTYTLLELRGHFPSRSRWPRIKDRKSKTGVESKRKRERERESELGLIEVMLVGNVVGIPVSLCRRVASPTGIVRARVFRLDNRPTPLLPPSLSDRRSHREPTTLCFCLSSIDIEGFRCRLCIENQPLAALPSRQTTRPPLSFSLVSLHIISLLAPPHKPCST